MQCTHSLISCETHRDDNELVLSLSNRVGEQMWLQVTLWEISKQLLRASLAEMSIVVLNHKNLTYKSVQIDQSALAARYSVWPDVYKPPRKPRESDVLLDAVDGPDGPLRKKKHRSKTAGYRLVRNVPPAAALGPHPPAALALPVAPLGEGSGEESSDDDSNDSEHPCPPDAGLPDGGGGLPDGGDGFIDGGDGLPDGGDGLPLVGGPAEGGGGDDVVEEDGAVLVRHPHPLIEIYDDDGALLGYIKKRNNGETQTLDAHCSFHKDELNCKTDRTVKPGMPGTAQGRPMGYLLAWLLMGRRDWCTCGEYKKARRGAGACAADVDFDSRIRARVWGMEKPELAELFEFERQDLWPGEDIEPKKRP